MGQDDLWSEKGIRAVFGKQSVFSTGANKGRNCIFALVVLTAVTDFSEVLLSSP